jgi:hypothetical protein
VDRRNVELKVRSRFSKAGARARPRGITIVALAADGALGAHAAAVADAYRDFREVARSIATRVGLPAR